MAGRLPSLLAILVTLALLASACAQDTTQETAAPDPASPDTPAEEATAEPDGPESTEDEEVAYTGACADMTGVTDDTITVGQLMGLSGVMQALAERFLAGFDAYIDRVNSEGGVAGRQIQIRRVDNEFRPDVSVTRFEEVQDDVVMITSQGSAATNAILADIDQACMPTLVFGNAGLNALDEHTFLYATPYAYHALNIMEWAVRERGATGTWGIIHSSDALGDEVLQATRFAADMLGVDLAVEASFEYPTDQDFSGQIRQLTDAGVEWVMLAALPPSSTGIVGQAASAGASFSWVSPQTASSGETDFEGPASQLFDDVDLYLATCCAGWNSSDAPGLQQVKDLIGEHSDAEGFLPLLGYVWARLVVDLLEEAATRDDFRRGAVTEAIGRLGTIDTDDVTCTYTFGEEGQPNNPTRQSMIVQIDASNPPDGFVLVQDCFTSEAAEAFQLSQLR
jgi:ABC-type branched-subunit amino acid transport system substrate-binding protein